MAMFDREMRCIAASPRWLADYRVEQDPAGRSHEEAMREIERVSGTQLDPALIGGAVLRAGDLVIDGSLRSRLARMQYELTV